MAMTDAELRSLLGLPARSAWMAEAACRGMVPDVLLPAAGGLPPTTATWPTCRRYRTHRLTQVHANNFTPIWTLEGLKTPAGAPSRPNDPRSWAPAPPAQWSGQTSDWAFRMAWLPWTMETHAPLANRSSIGLLGQ